MDEVDAPIAAEATARAHDGNFLGGSRVLNGIFTHLLSPLMLTWLRFGDSHASDSDGWGSLDVFSRLMDDANRHLVDAVDFAVQPIKHWPERNLPGSQPGPSQNGPKR